MSSRVRWNVLATGIAVAIVAAGCTQRESHEQYQRRLDASTREVDKVMSGLADEQGRMAGVRQLEQSRRTIRDVAEGFDQSGPPREVADAHELYGSALRSLSVVIGELADCARQEQVRPGSGAPCRARISQSRIDGVHNDIRQAEVMYRESGYKA